MLYSVDHGKAGVWNHDAWTWNSPHIWWKFHHLGFPGGSDGKESACNVGDLGLIPGFGRSPRGGHGNPLQCSCLENPHGQRSLMGYSPWGHKESDMTERLMLLLCSSLGDVATSWVRYDWTTVGNRDISLSRCLQRNAEYHFPKVSKCRPFQKQRWTR